MKKYVPILLILLAIAAAVYIYLYQSSAQAISLDDFKRELNQSKYASVVVDTRNSHDAFGCGIALVQNLETKGITTRYFFYDNNGCSYGGRVSDSGNTSIAQCQSMLTDPVIFYIQYNAARNSTTFYRSKAVTEGDNNFIADCSIAKIV